MTTQRLHSIVLSLFVLFVSIASSAQTFSFGTKKNPKGETIEVDSHGLILNGKHFIPVMGEIHYARVPASDWRREIRKMRAGGITVVATYVFWIHHEEEEGMWNWSGNRDLHAFLNVCKEENMPVVLRIGPFCHGEVYQGGIPEWIVSKAQEDAKQYKLRSMAPGFLAAVHRLYSNIFAQANDMLWKNGGPIIGVQIENECRGPWNYYMALKDMAVGIGFDTPFYTRTGWPKLNGNEEFGKLLPLYGDYADGFWDRTLNDMPGEYAKAFIMKDTRISGVIATETFGNNQDTKMGNSERKYPYLTCELGGGMMPSYHRRINMNGNEPLPLAICKVGSGSNLPGYYMYHGGSNPYSDKHTMAECQASPVTNYNDMPHISYDFQSPLGEMGQPNDKAFHQTRLFHQFLADWGDELAMMDVDTLSEHYARRGCFEFYNDYVRILNEKGNCYVRPVGMKFCGHIISADAQPFCKTGNRLYLIPIKGKRPCVWIDGKKHVMKYDKPLVTKDFTVTVLSEAKAMTAFKIDYALHYSEKGGILYKNDEGDIVEETWQEGYETVGFSQIQKEGRAREIGLGTQKVAEQPDEEDFDNAAAWAIVLPKSITDAEDSFLEISYDADCARVYADDKLVEDNFWNGKPMLVRISDLIEKKVELRILPLRKDAPIYLQKEQKAVLNAESRNTLLKLNSIKVIKRTVRKI